LKRSCGLTTRRVRAVATVALRQGGIRLSHQLAKVWNDALPMVVPPATDDGLGVVFLNSNAEAHFSFTNALGMVSALLVQGLEAAARQFPRAGWIVALHHHLVEYPTPAQVFSERIGTALVNGSWFVRQLRPLAGRLVVFHLLAAPELIEVRLSGGQD
jgi:hypothetical protein